MYEGTDYLVVKSVKVDNLPECDAANIVEDRVDSSCEIEPSVIDAKKEIMNMRAAKAHMLEAQKKREEDLALKEKIKRERYLKKHPEIAKAEAAKAAAVAAEQEKLKSQERPVSGAGSGDDAESVKKVQV